MALCSVSKGIVYLGLDLIRIKTGMTLERCLDGHGSVSLSSISSYDDARRIFEFTGLWGSSVDASSWRLSESPVDGALLGGASPNDEDDDLKVTAFPLPVAGLGALGVACGSDVASTFFKAARIPV
jgi:hypothetical protein